MNYLTQTCEFCGQTSSAIGPQSIVYYPNKNALFPSPSAAPVHMSFDELKRYYRFSFAACPTCRPKLNNKSWQEAWDLHVPHAVAAALESKL